MFLFIFITILINDVIKSSKRKQSLQTSDDSLNQNHEKIKTKQVKSSGSCGSSLTYLIEDTKLIIEGSGDMMDYSYDSSSPWHSLSTTFTIVELPPGITSIGSYAFYEFTNLKTIAIPDDVISIGSFAFSRCSSMLNFTIPPKVTVISNNLFSLCNSLSTINIHDEVTTIEANDFHDIIGLW